MKRHSFKGKVLVALVIFSVSLITSICLTVGIYYKKMEMERYSELAYSYARTAAEYIDGDKVLGYLETGQKDAYYEQVLNFLNCTQAESDLQYYYVFVPYEDYLVYVWDAEEEEGSCPLGYQEEYMEGGKAASDLAMTGEVPDDIYITDDGTYGYIGSAYYPVYNSAGESVALVGVDLSIPNINRNLMYFVTAVILCVVLVVLVFISILYAIFNRSFITPINKLNAATKKMVSNLEQENDFQIAVHTKDEIEELADSFSQMYVEVKNYIGQLTAVTAEKERIGAELDVARHIQAAMLPCIFPAFPERHEFDIYATMTPAKEVGGDFYDFFLIDEDHLAMVMADVSGKGVPAALFMMISKTLIKSAAQTGLSPRGVLEKVNNQLCENNEAEMFVTVWLGILEISTGKLVCANAGHEYPAIRRKNGMFELYKDKHGFVLAGMENARYREYELELADGDAIFVYTDGVAEATNAREELYGTERMINALNKRQGLSCKDLLEVVQQDVDEFVAEAPQFDDITMLCLAFGNRMEERTVNMKELTISATVGNIAKVTAFVDEQLEALDCPMKAQMQIDIAIDELFGNIAHYAYDPGVGEATVRVEVAEDPLAVEITFIDRGIPYDPLAQEDPDVTLSAEEREAGGLGIYIVKKSMDAIRYEYRDGKNILWIKKNI